MPMLTVILVAIATTAYGKEPASLTQTYPDDTIRFLWWALGLAVSAVSAMWAGVGVWMIKKILDHDKDIVAIKTKCDIECAEED